MKEELGYCCLFKKDTRCLCYAVFPLGGHVDHILQFLQPNFATQDLTEPAAPSDGARQLRAS